MSSAPLRRADLDLDPLRQFAAWYTQAGDAVPTPEAVVLATATAAGAPSARMVLLKGFDQRGFVFYTNYFSRKGQEIAQNPRAALLFHWVPLGRQVRVEGAVAQGRRRRVRRLLQDPPPGQPAERGRLAAEPPGRESRGARGRRHGARGPASRGRRAPAAGTGAACASSPRSTSSGSTATTACTTASATGGTARRGGSIGWVRKGGTVPENRGQSPFTFAGALRARPAAGRRAAPRPARSPGGSRAVAPGRSRRSSWFADACFGGRWPRRPDRRTRGG